MSRSPPPVRRHVDQEPSPCSTAVPGPAPTKDMISTPEIQKWMAQIEHCLNEICTIAGDGKLNTEQKLKISNISRSVLGGASQMAVQYQSLKQKYISASTLINASDEQVNIAAQLKDLKNCVQSVPRASPSNQSFADMVRKGGMPLVCPSKTSSIAIYPANKDTSSDVTKKILQNLIKPEELKLHISGMRKTKGGGVVISSERKDDLIKLKQSEQLKTSGLKVEDATKKRPKVIVLGVPSTISDKDLLECLYEQNISDKHPSLTRNTLESSIKLSHKSGKKNEPTFFINWTSCPVRDYTIVTRCYKCQQYGHSAKFCRDTESTCGHCGCTGHSIKECSKHAEPAKCATCIRFNKPANHKTGDEQCPARKSAVTRHIGTIDYEGA
ncbi:uncharacterized protein LOC113238556 [Hyposmocoma kahamanoa]|uniref:uncharacterized protein LOC113238556 n=1 Tax=Hyposmocoma kahamanoa TaxID=1477025 RepID=UPI000E6D9548|nr:uncharacterized protein LOC113238556 [Hyposmocoma kahamanoa]